MTSRPLGPEDIEGLVAANDPMTQLVAKRVFEIRRMGVRDPAKFAVSQSIRSERKQLSQRPAIFRHARNDIRVHASFIEAPRKCLVDLKTKFQAEEVRAEICLGVTVAGIETLIGLCLILFLMK
jgi:hypothetical protein